MAEDRDRDDRSDKFAWGAGVVLTQCVFCAHAADGPERACAAFPGGVPAEIVENRFDHRRPHLGDGGIRFEPREDASPVALATLYRALDGVGA